jgi:hypothetical protein
VADGSDNRDCFVAGDDEEQLCPLFSERPDCYKSPGVIDLESVCLVPSDEGTVIVLEKEAS